MIEYREARASIIKHLKNMEREIEEFGSALPNHQAGEHSELVITNVTEHEFGWILTYNTKKFLETNDFRSSLPGNAPFIVDKADGEVYVTGTAEPLNHYLRIG